jgi:acyl dehydratase
VIERPTVGTQLPPLEFAFDLMRLVVYSGATWDWFRTHYDSNACAQQGLRAPIVDGQMLGALLARQATTWAGPTARIRRMSFRFARPVFAGDIVRCEARVSAVDDATAMWILTLDQRVMCDGKPAVAPASTALEVRHG